MVRATDFQLWQLLVFGVDLGQLQMHRQVLGVIVQGFTQDFLRLFVLVIGAGTASASGNRIHITVGIELAGCSRPWCWQGHRLAGPPAGHHCCQTRSGGQLCTVQGRIAAVCGGLLLAAAPRQQAQEQNGCCAACRYQRIGQEFSRKEGSGAGGGGGAGRFFGSGLGLGCSSAVGAVGISACGGDVGVSTAGAAGRLPGTATPGVAVPAAPPAAPAPAAPALSAWTAVPAVLCAPVAFLLAFPAREVALELLHALILGAALVFVWPVCLRFVR